MSHRINLSRRWQIVSVSAESPHATKSDLMPPGWRDVFHSAEIVDLPLERSCWIDSELADKKETWVLLRRFFGTPGGLQLGDRVRFEVAEMPTQARMWFNSFEFDGVAKVNSTPSSGSSIWQPPPKRNQLVLAMPLEVIERLQGVWMWLD